MAVGIVRGDTLQKIGSAGFIAGAFLFVSGGLLLPHASNPVNLQEMLRPLGEHALRTQLSSLLMAAGTWALMTGAMAVYRSVTSHGAAWARAGFSFFVVGTALWTVSLSCDVAVAGAVAAWLQAPDAAKDGAFAVVAALSAFGHGVYPLSIVVFWLAIFFLCIGMVRSSVYPPWMGRMGLILAGAVIPVGIAQVFVDRSVPLTLLFLACAMVTGLWSVLVGIWVARRAW